MKIRIKDNSVRFRLAQNEVADLVNNGETYSKSDIGKQTLVYGIVKTSDNKISCSLADNRIIAHVPSSLLLNWDTDERVGFHNEDNDLFILIEKDWQCLVPRENENESNLFVNPKESHL